MTSTKLILFISNQETSVRFSILKTTRWNCKSPLFLAALVSMYHHLKPVQSIRLIRWSWFNLINVDPQFKVHFYRKNIKSFWQHLFDWRLLRKEPAQLDDNSSLMPHNGKKLSSYIFQFLKPVFICRIRNLILSVQNSIFLTMSFHTSIQRIIHSLVDLILVAYWTKNFLDVKQWRTNFSNSWNFPKEGRVMFDRRFLMPKT